jgi:lipopolysaccharide export system protein LptC
VPRAHWLVLAVGIVLIVLATVEGDPEAPAPAVIAGGDAGLGEPDLAMETARISQFAPDGRLRYRIRADEIVHYPDAGHTLLSAPHLTLFRPGDAPWEVSAHRGRIVGGDGLLDGGATPGDDADGGAPEVVILEESVVVRRERDAGGFVELSTDRLTLHPDREYAETDAPVIIDTHTGRTTATGMSADLARGRIELDPDPAQRVRTTLFPGSLR